MLNDEYESALALMPLHGDDQMVITSDFISGTHDANIKWVWYFRSALTKLLWAVAIKFIDEKKEKIFRMIIIYLSFLHRSRVGQFHQSSTKEMTISRFNILRLTAMLVVRRWKNLERNLNQCQSLDYSALQWTVIPYAATCTDFFLIFSWMHPMVSDRSVVMNWRQV